MLLFSTRSGGKPNGGFAWEKWHADVIGYCTGMEEVSTGAAVYSLPYHPDCSH